MYDQIRQDAIFIMLYAVITVLALLGSCYLLFRRGNAFAPDVTPPLQLRRWAAAFLAIIALNHLWYMPILFLSTEADILLCDLLGGLLDSMTFFPLSVVIMLTMLQDRRRLLWPIFVAFVPLFLASAWSVVTRSYDISPVCYSYFLLLVIALIIYMVREVRRYGRWLRDNYADLEHKEVWQSFLVMAVIMLTYVSYALSDEGTVFIYVLHSISLVLVLYLPWRVETLSDLSISQPLTIEIPEDGKTAIEREESQACLSYPEREQAQPQVNTGIEDDGEHQSSNTLSDTTYEQIGSLLKQHCEATRLYLHHGLTLAQLAQAIGSNRTYLDLYFSSQNTTYNNYINGLRILHFVSLYREAVTDGRDFTAKKLALESGYRSYTTFSVAFKQRMGQSVTEWMRGG